jgi:lipoyl-dependent peroxiredoxin
MATRRSDAVWEGDLKQGKGTMKLGSGAYEGSYTFLSRFEDGKGTNPEELIAAAHAGCFSMALSHALSEAGHVPKRVETSATVHLVKGDGGFRISKIDLDTKGNVPGISADEFQRQAEQAKQNCPVSKVLSGAEITLKATLAN